MLHITFNFLDRSVQLRLLALVAAVIFIVCLGIWEFSNHMSAHKITTLVVLMTLCSGVIAYVLAALGGIL